MPAPDFLDVRILADDLTGALDSAVAFAGSQGFDVTWRTEAAPGRRIAIDLATRECDQPAAASRHRMLAPWLAEGRVCFKKIDSLLRGHVAAEIGACIGAGFYERVVVAPAFPFQGRVTRDGRQWRLGEDAATVGPDLAQILAQEFQVSKARPTETARGPVVVYDADTDADLDRVVAAEMAAPASVLWVGSGGLASALARHFHVPQIADPRLEPPFLALVGTDHPVTGIQIQHFAARFADGHVAIGDDRLSARRRLLDRMGRGLPTLLSVEASGPRDAVARRIDDAFAALLEDLPAPGLLLVTGGETLHGVCDRLGADRLTIACEFEPGLPISRIYGGAFHGLTTISKSGAFGSPDLLVRIVEAIGS